MPQRQFPLPIPCHSQRVPLPTRHLPCQRGEPHAPPLSRQSRANLAPISRVRSLRRRYLAADFERRRERAAQAYHAGVRRRRSALHCACVRWQRHLDAHLASKGARARAVEASRLRRARRVLRTACSAWLWKLAREEDCRLAFEAADSRRVRREERGAWARWRSAAELRRHLEPPSHATRRDGRAWPSAIARPRRAGRVAPAAWAWRVRLLGALVRWQAAAAGRTRAGRRLGAAARFRQKHDVFARWLLWRLLAAMGVAKAERAALLRTRATHWASGRALQTWRALGERRTALRRAVRDARRQSKRRRLKRGMAALSRRRRERFGLALHELAPGCSARTVRLCASFRAWSLRAAHAHLGASKAAHARRCDLAPISP